MPQIAWFRGVVGDGKPLVASRIKELARDDKRALYRYHQVFPHGGRTLTRKSMIAAVRLAPWSDGSIRRHEETVAAARDAYAKELAASGVEVAPILAGYRDAAGEVDRLFKKTESERPIVDTTTPDGTRHVLWRLTAAEVFGQMRHAFAPKKVFVLDPPDRYEGRLAYQDQLGSLAMYSSGNYTMMCLVNMEDPGLVPVGRHRVVRGVTKEAALDAAKAHFIVEKVAREPRAIADALAETLGHQPAFVAAFPDEAWKLTLSPDVAPARQGVPVHRALQKLDPVVLDAMFLARLGNAQVATETSLTAALDAGADLAILVRPLPIDQIIHVTDLGQVVPAGSSAFAPPVLPLVANVIDRDEDLV